MIILTYYLEIEHMYVRFHWVISVITDLIYRNKVTCIAWIQTGYVDAIFNIAHKMVYPHVLWYIWGTNTLQIKYAIISQIY